MIERITIMNHFVASFCGNDLRITFSKWNSTKHLQMEILTKCLETSD